MITSFSKNTLFCAVDMGTSSIKIAIAQKTHQDWDILGFGMQVSDGIKKGSIYDLEKSIRSVRFALEEAELKAGAKGHIIISNLSGPYVESFNSKGVIPIRHSFVQPLDIQEVIDAAKGVTLPAEHRILHSIPQFFTIDEHQKISDPLHMSGIRLEAHVHLITASIHAMKTKLQVLSHLGLQAHHVVLDSLAVAASSLLPDEKHLGVAVLDLGCGTSKIAVFKEGILLHTMILPLGSDHVTSDVALAFRTPVSAAEVLKIRHGSLLSSYKVMAEHPLNIPLLGDKKTQQITQKDLASVITPRVEEIFQLIVEDLHKFNLINAISAGIVLTGGGSQLEGIAELATDIFGVSVRVGANHQSSSSHHFFESAQASTLMGLLEWGHQQYEQVPQSEKKELGIIWSRFKNWLTG